MVFRLPLYLISCKVVAMQKIFPNILKFLGQLSLPIFLGLLVIVTFLVGALDLATGLDLSVSFLYLIPVSMVAWRLGRIPGMIGAVLEAGVWVAVFLLEGQKFFSNFIPFWNGVSRAIVFIVVALLVSEVRRLLDFEHGLASTDPLTGVLNRRSFYTLVEQELARVKRYERPATLLYLDADNFKLINDQFGHQAGDQLLTTVAETIARNIRAIDKVARLGGDEFAVLLPETGEIGARTIAPRLYWHLKSEMERAGWHVTFSIGALICHNPLAEVEATIKRSDQLMYDVKQMGKDGIAYAIL